MLIIWQVGLDSMETASLCVALTGVDYLGAGGFTFLTTHSQVWQICACCEVSYNCGRGASVFLHLDLSEVCLNFPLN